MELQDKVKYVRSKLKLSQEDLARELNVSFHTVNRWENGKTKPIKITKAVFDSFCEKHSIFFNEND